MLMMVTIYLHVDTKGLDSRFRGNDGGGYANGGGDLHLRLSGRLWIS